MADSITILEGPVKFREGKKWKSRWCVLRRLSPVAGKSRWCVLRRLSPVADAVELALYAESFIGNALGRCKATVSLAGWVGCIQGVSLDRQAHTLALLVSADAGAEGVGAMLALESRAELLQWVARVEGALGSARQHHVALVGGSLAPVVGTLLLTARRMALVTGTPPTVRAVWELQHLRRFGAVDGRFVWEAGALGAGAASGVHCAASDDVTRLNDDVTWAARGLLDPRRRHRAAHVDGSSPTSMRTSRGTLTRPPRQRSPPATMPRCVSCSAALCLAANAQGHGFSPAWSMPPPRPSRMPITPYDNYDVPKMPSIEMEGEYYDTPRRLRGRLPRSVTVSGGMKGRGDVSELYAVVDVARKARRRHHDSVSAAHYENGVFARSLRHYENARDVLPRASSAEYLPMQPVSVPAHYARMAPIAPTPRRRAASDPLLVDEEVYSTHRATNRDSSSSGDSGVCCEGRLRRTRSAELALCVRVHHTNTSTSAEAAVPLHPRARSRAGDTRSTSSGASDLSDYMETLSLSSHSSTDAHRAGVCRPSACGGASVLLRPRSGREYSRLSQPPPPTLPPRTIGRRDV